MTLRFELNLADEYIVQIRAEREGITVEEFARRCLLGEVPSRAEGDRQISHQANLTDGLLDEKSPEQDEASVMGYPATTRLSAFKLRLNSKAIAAGYPIPFPEMVGSEVR